jgi:hypothetical protein
MSELGTNAIRVYHVDPNADHKGCMTALADAGMYGRSDGNGSTLTVAGIHLFVDLDTFTTQIEQVGVPLESGSDQLLTITDRSSLE